jgi:hypothetical protein
MALNLLPGSHSELWPGWLEKPGPFPLAAPSGPGLSSLSSAVWPKALHRECCPLFPIHGFTPALGVGIVACVILAVALFALYKEHLVGAWRWIYVVTAVMSLYLNVFVLVVQSFVKVSALNALAPTQTEPPFAVTQAAVLAIFILITLIAIIKFRPPKTQM